MLFATFHDEHGTFFYAKSHSYVLNVYSNCVYQSFQFFSSMTLNYLQKNANNVIHVHLVIDLLLYYYFTDSKFVTYALTFFHGNLTTSLLVYRTLQSILADFNRALLWMDSIILLYPVLFLGALRKWNLQIYDLYHHHFLVLQFSSTPARCKYLSSFLPSFIFTL